MRSVAILPVCTRVRVMAILLPLLLPIAATGQPWQLSGRADLARFSAVYLQAHANQQRLHDFHTLQPLPGNNLAALAAGKHDLLGITFEIDDGVIQLGSTLLKSLPQKVNLKIGKKFNTLHVLHAAAFSVNEGGVTIATYTLHYDDGKSHTITVVNGKDIGSFWKRPGAAQATAAREAWVGSNDHVKKLGAEIRLFVSSMDNPRPGSIVDSIDFASTMTKAAPFCVAMTVAAPLQPRPPAKSLTAADLERLWIALSSTGAPCCDAIETLAGAPEQALPFLRPRVRTARPTADVKKVAALITVLNDEDFAEREIATAELQKLGLEALPQLRRIVTEAKSAEVRRRAQWLVEKLHRIRLTPDDKRLQAVVRVLELMASDEAHKILDELARGKTGTWLAAEAAAALTRMGTPKRAAD